MKDLHSDVEYSNKRKTAMQQSLKNDPLRGKKITNGKLTLTQEQVDQIWELCWSEHRGIAYYKELAIQFNIGYHSIQKIALGGYCLKLVSKEQMKIFIDQWNEKYRHLKGQRISSKKMGHSVSCETRKKISDSLKSKK